MVMTQVIIENIIKNHLDCRVCIGGGGTQKNAYRLMQHGFKCNNHTPKPFDNDVWGTDVTFGFDTALENSHRSKLTAFTQLPKFTTRVIVVEIMGHRAGWLALGAGLSVVPMLSLYPKYPMIPKMLLNR
jgi:6-phosphofructokinase 1